MKYIPIMEINVFGLKFERLTLLIDNIAGPKTRIAMARTETPDMPPNTTGSINRIKKEERYIKDSKNVGSEIDVFIFFI